MGLIQLVIMLAVVGFILWLILTYIPMPDPFKKIIIVIVVIVLILYLLSVFGIMGNMDTIHVGRIH